MNTFQRHFKTFPSFIEKILSWGPDFVVPVAKKGCKLIKTIDDNPQLLENRELIKYRAFFELTGYPLHGKKVAVMDDATQYTSTLQDYRRFFDNLGATVRTFSFVGHEDLLTGARGKDDPFAEIERPLPEPVYQEYLLQQAYHLLTSGNHFDLDHLIFEIKISPGRLDDLERFLKTQGQLLFVEDYFLKTHVKRFSLDQPLFFTTIPYLNAPAVSLGPLKKIKFAYDKISEKLHFSPLSFPIWDFGLSVGSSLLQAVPFSLPYRLPYFLDKKNRSALLRAYYNIYFACVVSFAKAFTQTVLRKENLDQSICVRRNDLDAVLGVKKTDDFISSIKEFVTGAETYDFSGPIPAVPRAKKCRFDTFAAVIDELKAGYERKVQRSKSRVGVHYFLSYESLFRNCRDPITLSEDLDYYCDFGVIVPEIFFQKGRILRGCRTGEPKADYNWQRTQVLIPIAIDQFHAELNKRSKGIAEPTALNKLLANFCFDYPSEVYHELHCLIGKPYTFGTLVHAYHRHRAPNMPNLYQTDRISPYYVWSRDRRAFLVKDRRGMVKQIATVFDERQEIPYSEIVSYFRIFARIYGMFNNVDVLNMLSICREQNWFYSHVLYNVRTSMEEFGLYLDTNKSDRVNLLASSRDNAQSAFSKLQLAKETDQTIKKIVKRFGGEVEFVKTVEKIKKNCTPFESSFKEKLKQVEELVILELILTNLCSLFAEDSLSYFDKLNSLNCHHVLEKEGIAIPRKLTAIGDDEKLQKKIVDDVYRVVISKFDALPSEEPILLERLKMEAYRRAKNGATIYISKAKFSQAVFLFTDFSGLRMIPEPKEAILSRFYQVVEKNLDRRGGHKLYGGSGGDDMFTILFGDVLPALECAKDIKKDFAEDLFLSTSNYDVKFGLSFVVFSREEKEEEIIQTWGDAKDCCEFKGLSFRNRGDLIISEKTFELLHSIAGGRLAKKFVAIPSECLGSGLRLFTFTEIRATGKLSQN